MELKLSQSTTTLEISNNLVEKITTLRDLKSLELGYNLINKFDSLEELFLMSKNITEISELPENLQINFGRDSTRLVIQPRISNLNIF